MKPDDRVEFIREAAIRIACTISYCLSFTTQGTKYSSDPRFYQSCWLAAKALWDNRPEDC